MKRTSRFLPGAPAAWLAAAFLGTTFVPVAALGAEEKSPAAMSAPLVPKPAPARREDLPAAFSKVTPGSIADLKAMQKQVVALVAKISPAVVAVEIGQGSGSGVIISADGLVLTAGHVCGRANRDVQFTFPDGKTVRGKTLGVSLESDTGLMRITDRGSWPHVDTGDLAQTRVGDWVLALGHPGGFDLRRSLVVRLGRIIRVAPDALQTDCPISPGDSGGPLFDMHGRVIGIHSFISSSTAANFHVPVTQFYDTWEELVQAETETVPAVAPLPSAVAPRAYVGARAVDDAQGCRIDAVAPASPAARAGLKVNDRVLRVNGRDIKAAAVFRRWVAEAEPGETLNVEIQRGDQSLTLRVKVEAAPGRN